jgi:hypothetical protein
MAGLALGVFGGAFFGLFMAGFMTFICPERRLSTAGEAATAPGETFEVEPAHQAADGDAWPHLR